MMQRASSERDNGPMNYPMASTNVCIMCPNLVCRKILAVPPECRGKTVRCKNCGTNIRVPSKEGTPTPGDPKAKSAA